MEERQHANKTFDKVKWTGQRVADREFDRCTFMQCDLSGSDFTGTRFTDCTFIGCNLSMVKLTNVALRNGVFKECKLLGVDLGKCKPMLFSVSFDQCVLDHAVFAQRKMPGTRFTRCSLKEVDFEGADLDEAVFDQCDLSGALFSGTQLRKADLSSAYNIALDPERNLVKGAHFSMEGALGLLGKYGLRID